MFEIGPSNKARVINYDWKGMGVRKGSKRSFALLLEIGTKNQELLVNLKSGA